MPKAYLIQNDKGFERLRLNKNQENVFILIFAVVFQKTISALWQHEDISVRCTFGKSVQAIQYAFTASYCVEYISMGRLFSYKEAFNGIWIEDKPHLTNQIMWLLIQRFR